MSNLPPGVTTRMIDAAAGADTTCGAQSPDGRFECDLSYDHAVESHEQHAPVIAYTKVPLCSNPNCPAPDPNDPNGFPCDHDFTPGSWVPSDAYGNEGYVVIASWPKRDDDFDGDGNPTDRRR